MTDEMAMERVVQGKLEWAAFLFERHHKRVFNYFYKMTLNKSESEDMTQDVFYRMLKYRHSYRLGASFKPWLFTMARNVWLKQIQHKKQTILLPLIDIEPDRDLILENQLDLLERALKLLPEEDREIIVLVKIEKIAYQDLAVMMNASEGALRVKAHRSLRQLKGIYHQLLNK